MAKIPPWYRPNHQIKNCGITIFGTRFILHFIAISIEVLLKIGLFFTSVINKCNPHTYLLQTSFIYILNLEPNYERVFEVKQKKWIF